MVRVIQGAEGLPVVTGAPWQGVQYFCTQRMGGLSQPPYDSLNLGQHVGDDPAAVAGNRARVTALTPGRPLWLEQVHGVAVCDADNWRGSNPPRADAAVTTRVGRPLAIMVADCLPVVLADESGRVLGVAHAGWRGLAAGVLENTLQALRERRPDARVWRAWIGPAIGPLAFEVGADVRDAFMRVLPQAADFFRQRADGIHWMADLAGLARLRLQRAGVTHVEASGQCTYTQAEDYFSYRRQSPTGRQALIAWRDSDLP